VALLRAQEAVGSNPAVSILESMSYGRRRNSDEEQPPKILFVSPPQLSGSAFYVYF